MFDCRVCATTARVAPRKLDEHGDFSYFSQILTPNESGVLVATLTLQLFEMWSLISKTHWNSRENYFYEGRPIGHALRATVGPSTTAFVSSLQHEPGRSF